MNQSDQDALFPEGIYSDAEYQAIIKGLVMGHLQENSEGISEDDLMLALRDIEQTKISSILIELLVEGKTYAVWNEEGLCYVKKEEIVDRELIDDVISRVSVN